MTITDVVWSRDIRGRPVLELKLDGHPAYIHSSQRTDLTRRGLLDGMVFLKSERASQVPSDYITGNYAPDYEGLDLVGWTDNPQVFALYQEMSRAISTDAWHAGPRPTPA
jgi:hypothetical protein